MTDSMKDTPVVMPLIHPDGRAHDRPASAAAVPRDFAAKLATAPPPSLPVASFAKRSLPKPSSLYSTLWRFASERHRVYLQRVAGQPQPWTGDSVLSTYRFTNAFRAADRVSQYLIRMAYSDHDATDDTLFLRTTLFKIFNKIDTWESIVRETGSPTADRFDYLACDELLDRRRKLGKTIYSAAYIMPPGGPAGGTKHRMHLQLLRRMMDDGLPTKIRRSRTLKDAYALLLGYPTLGPFLAFQYAIDLNYTALTSHSEWSFVAAGPGALDGLSKCFESLGEYSPEDTILWLSDRQEEEFCREDLHFNGLWGRSLRPIDVQNLLCEVSKYTRATHPEIKGRAGRERIKQRFSAAGPVPKPFFPPKWELNEHVEKWFRNLASVPRPTTLQAALPLTMPGRS